MTPLHEDNINNSSIEKDLLPKQGLEVVTFIYVHCDNQKHPKNFKQKPAIKINELPISPTATISIE